jgi:hypothetical protein
MWFLLLFKPIQVLTSGLIRWKLYARWWFHFTSHIRNYSFVGWPMATIYSCGVWKIFVEIKNPLIFLCCCLFLFTSSTTMSSVGDGKYVGHKLMSVGMWVCVCVEWGQENNESYSMLKNLWHSSTWIFPESANTRSLCPFFIAQHHSMLNSQFVVV